MLSIAERAARQIIMLVSHGLISQYWAWPVQWLTLLRYQLVNLGVPQEIGIGLIETSGSHGSVLVLGQ